MSDEFEQGTDETLENNWSERAEGVNGTSRRNFLKVAVVSSAATAAAIGVAGVAATAIASSSQAPSGLTKLLSVNVNVVSTENACVTNTATHLVKVDPSKSSTYLNGNESLYVWAWFTLGSAGTYTAKLLLPTLPVGASITEQNDSGSQQEAYQGLSGCPSKVPSGNTCGHGTGGTITFTVSKTNSTVLIKYHLKAKDVPAGNWPVAVEVTGPGSYDTEAKTTLYFFN